MLASKTPYKLIYGFTGVSDQSLLQIENHDAGTPPTMGKSKASYIDERSIMTMRQVFSHQSKRLRYDDYSELTLRRYDANGYPKLPDYIVLSQYDVNENGLPLRTALLHAKYFNIPIVIVNEESYYEPVYSLLKTVHSDSFFNKPYTEAMDDFYSYVLDSEYSPLLIGLPDELQNLNNSKHIANFRNLKFKLFPDESELVSFETMEMEHRIEYVKKNLDKSSIRMFSKAYKNENGTSIPVDYAEIKLDDGLNTTAIIFKQNDHTGLYAEAKKRTGFLDTHDHEIERAKQYEAEMKKDIQNQLDVIERKYARIATERATRATVWAIAKERAEKRAKKEAEEDNRKAYAEMLANQQKRLHELHEARRRRNPLYRLASRLSLPRPW